MHLSCVTRFEAPAAELLIDTLPETIRRLDFCTDACIVSYAGLSRLKQLTHLTLALEDDEPHLETFVHDPSRGLASLQGLQALTVSAIFTRDQIAAAELKLGNLEYLGLQRRPFTEDLNLSSFPSLRRIALRDSETYAPAWMSGPTIDQLECCSMGSFSSIGFGSLCCATLCVRHSAYEPDKTIRICDLLACPRLQKVLILAQAGTEVSTLIGPQGEFKQLLQSKRLAFDGQVDVQLTDAANAASSTPRAKIRLAGNGHPLLCCCRACQ